jgi:hypothetical protein
MLTCWAWCGMAISALLAGLALAALIPRLSGPAWVSNVALAALVSGMSPVAVISCFPLLPLLSGLAGVTRRSLWSRWPLRRWRWAHGAPGKRQQEQARPQN